MSPRFTHSRRSREIPAPPSWIEKEVLQNASYDTLCTFAHTNATAIPATSSTALPDSVTRNARSGADRSRAHTVRVRQRGSDGFG